MKNKLPVLTATVLMAIGAYAGHRSYRKLHQPATGESAAVSAAAKENATTVGADGKPLQTAGDRLLLQARTQLERRASIFARLRHQVNLGDHHMHGIGGYWQQGGREELKVRLELAVIGEETSLLQVSNGRFLWTDQKLPTGRAISHLDLRKIRYEANRKAENDETLEPGQASWFPIRPELEAKYGGLASLLTALERNFTFDPPQSMRWTPDPPLAGVAEKFPVFAVVGRWRPEALATIVADPNQRNELPDRVPEEVLLLFGQSDLVPYRLEFRKRVAPLAASPAGAGAPAPFQLSERPLVLLELEAVSFDASIAAGQFDYSPGDNPWDDYTDECLEQIRRDYEAKYTALKQAGRVQ